MNDIEPNIGDIRASVYPSGEKYRQIFVDCVQCGKGRWQAYRSKGTNRSLCSVCAAKKRMENPSFKEKILAGSRRRWGKLGEREKQSEIMQGENNPFYGNKHSSKALEKMSKPKVEVSIGHTREWGYLIGLVLGDGCIVKTNNGNYKTTVSSTMPEIVDIFYDCVRNLGLHCGYEIATIKPEWSAKSKIKSNATIRYTATLLSKKVYCWIRPYKYEDYHFTVPDMVFNHKDMASGFLQGFFDAEGGVYLAKESNSVNIQCWSKHIDNLLQVKELLKVLGIEAYVHSEKKQSISARLCISDYNNRLLFRELVGFRIERKQERLSNMKQLPNKLYSIEQYQKAMELREKGFTCYEIQEQTGVNHNTVAGWYCFRKNGRLPRVLRQNETHAKNNVELEELVS